MNTALKLLRSEEHISASSLNTYRDCPKRFEHRYVLRTPAESKSSGLVFGSAMHAALNLFYANLRDNKPEPTSEEMHKVFLESWQRELSGDVPVLLAEKETEAGLEELATKLIKVFLEKAERPHRVVEVEMPFSIDLGEDLPRLVGAYDTVVQDNNGSYRILEHKTAAKRWTPDKIAFDTQLTAYTTAAPFMGLGDTAVTIQLLLKTKKADMEVYTPARTESDKRDFIEMAVGVSKAVRAGIFWSNRDWWCRSCEFASQCLAG